MRAQQGVLLSAVSGVALIWVSPALGQTASQSAEEPAAAAAAGDPGEIVVTGYRRSLQSAQAIKRDSDQIVDAVVAEDIGKLPDNNASEALARITGVQVNRSSDEAGGVQVRGLPNLTTTYNGREVFTAELRNVALQDFPAGALAGLEVYKSTTADLIEGGIAGLINVRSRRPFDFDGFQIAGAVRATYADQAKKIDPNVNVLITDRWETGIGDIGALVNFSYTQLHYLTSSRYINGNIVAPHAEQSVTGPRDFVLPESAGVYYDRGKRWRPSINGALQWRPAHNLEFYVEGLWQAARTNVENDFVGVDMVNGNPALTNIVRDPDAPNQLASVTVTPNFAGGEDIDFSRSTRAGRTNTYQAAIGGRWEIDDRATLTTDLAYTDTNAVYTDHNIDFAPATGQSADIVFDVPGGDGGPQLSIPGFDALNPDNFILRGIWDRRSYAGGRGVQWRTDLKIKTDLPVITQFDFGFRYTDRDARLRSGGRYATLRPLGIPLSAIPGDGGPIHAGFRGSGDAQPFRQWYAPTRDAIFGNIDAIRDLARSGLAQIGTPEALAQLAAYGPEIPAFIANEQFDATERSYAVYGQIHYDTRIGSLPIDGVIGARIVNTATEATGTGLVNGIPTPATSRQNYVDVLPSATFRAHLTDQLQLRLSATETRTRPEFNQLSPALTINLNSTPLTGNSGNIGLQPIQSSNYDLSLEWYFTRTGSLTAAIFRRDVQGFITNLNVPVNDPLYGPVLVNRPENGGRGRLQGAEVAFQTFFDFLPGWLSGFGTQLNATYIDASQSLPPALGEAGQDTDIPGVSKWSFNAVGIYEKGPVSARLAYNWRSRVTNFFATDSQGQLIGAEFNRPIERLDFSLSVTPAEMVTLTFDVSNITGSPFRALRESPDQAGPGYPRDVRYESRVFALGARFRF
ncbi:TonB-dependent receptor [Sphingomonas psychrotolerans]|uniref:TonB-dependent receptor n=1 Tax=Sphingomonas psychrotolerans TaxID=1327635 RepID=A0ABU3N4L2_9SPHN|nr:TonB-dependent receptor [Sphingomonas psychrotolerans]MDT8758446.1 TonB-dependent receptor [Sphingomonas psychrotolerans]